MKTLYFDCFGGASGDMIVGALIDAGADFEMVSNALSSLGVCGFGVSAEKVLKHAIGATQFRVNVDKTHDHPHRHLADILAIVEGGDLPGAVKTASAETFRRIAECEAEIHGTSVEEVYFHEVGAVDSIVDIVATHLAMHGLGIERALSSPLQTGFGTVNTAHGVLPVPSPAAAMLLKGVPVRGGDIEGELVTPTGAALVTQLAESYGPLPEMRIEAIGYGSGTRGHEDRANVLRVLAGQTTDSVRGTEPITVIEANVDDMNPELLPPLLESLLAKGARDAFLTPLLGKKGRPAYLITALCGEDAVADVSAGFFLESTTFGVRIRTERRLCLAREWRTAATQWGDVRVKVGRYKGEVTCTAPEFEDCRRVAGRAGVPVIAVYEHARAAAVKGELRDG